MMSWSKTVALTGVVAALAACDGRKATELDAPELTAMVRNCVGPATSLPASLKAALPPETDPPNILDEWEHISATTPGGFAGVLYRDGQPVLRLTRPSEEGEARTALAPLLPSFPIAQAVVEPARWDFAQLVEWFDYITQTMPILSYKVQSLGMSAGRNRIEFGVTDSLRLEALRVFLEGQDIPCDLVLLRFTTEAHLRNDAP